MKTIRYKPTGLIVNPWVLYNMKHYHSFYLFCTVVLTLLLSGCHFVSKVSTPDLGVELPQRYRYQKQYAGSVAKEWWREFGDAKLNALQRDLLATNTDLKIALANYDASLGALGVTRADLLPRIDASGSVTRNRDSESNRFPLTLNPSTNYTVTAQLGYEVDLWGRVRALIRAGEADVEVNRLLLADTQTALQVQLAQQYFALRFLDAERALLSDVVSSREEALRLGENRLAGGVGAALDVSRAKSILAAAKSDVIGIDRQRVELEVAIAVLLGKPASGFSIPRNHSAPRRVPHVPVGVPANLLVRRADIGAAYAQLEASSARLGVAKTAPYPRLSLTANGGLFSLSDALFLDSSSRTFSIGPSIEAPLFAGGRVKKNLRQVRARQQSDLARFQQVTLSALGEVESALSSVRLLKQEISQREIALQAYSETLRLAKIQYEEGRGDYLAVIDADRERLLAQRVHLQARSELHAQTIQLIRALGGGFTR